MRKTLILVIALMAAMTARADEGMWLPSLISQRIADMLEKGFRLDADGSRLRTARPPSKGYSGSKLYSDCT